MKAYLGVAVGIGKSKCEDSAFANELLVDGADTEWECDTLGCIGVADGVGGNAGGRLASRFISSRISRTDFSQMTENSIRQFTTELNEELIQYAADFPGKVEMATTLTCVVAASDGFYLIHAGNARLYVLQGRYLKQLTTDHTTYNWLMELGQYEAAERCCKSEINCCLGGGDSRYANRIVIQKLFEDTLPDTLLLTSDGVHEFVDIDNMEEILTEAASDPEAIKMLFEKAAVNGSTDDKTVIIVRR